MRVIGSVNILSAVGVLLLASAASADSARVGLEIRSASREVLRGGVVRLDVRARVERGWHINGFEPIQLYLIPTEVRFTLPSGVTAEAVRYPEAELKAMAFAGGEELLVYEGVIELATTLNVSQEFQGRQLPIQAVLRYQACNDTTCLPPNVAVADLVLSVVGSFVDEPLQEQRPSHSAPRPLTQFDRRLRESGLVLTLLAVALLGLGLNLTPCVYPLISVTIAYFGSQSGGSRRVIPLALVYVLGIAVSFSLLGLAAALSGGLFGAALQQPTVVIFIAGVLVLLALGSFGFYQFQPPAVLIGWAGKAANGTVGALVMGCTMGVVAAPCVGPIVIGLLVFVGSRQDPLLGFLLFFALALGMGAPYVVLATAAGAIRGLPRSGEWLVWTERLFGCILLCLAAYFVAPLLPQTARQYVVSAVVAASAIYLGFLEPAGRRVRYFALLRWTVAVALLGFAVWFARPVGSGPGVVWESPAVLREHLHGGVGTPILVDFAAEWCIPCREMDHTTYVHPEVVREARRFRMVKADITHESDATAGIVDEYEVRGVPTVLLLSSQGEERQRMVGYVGPTEMLAAMRAVR